MLKTPSSDQRINPIVAGLTCRCPRCGKGKLFDGYLKLAPRCEACGLDYGFADPADGPAFFVMTAISLLVVGFWVAWVISARPPVWEQLAVVTPAITIGCLATLRPTKAWLVASQFYYKARDVNFNAEDAGSRV